MQMNFPTVWNKCTEWWWGGKHVTLIYFGDLGFRSRFFEVLRSN